MKSNWWNAQCALLWMTLLCTSQVNRGPGVQFGRLSGNYHRLDTSKHTPTIYHNKQQARCIPNKCLSNLDFSEQVPHLNFEAFTNLKGGEYLASCTALWPYTSFILLDMDYCNINHHGTTGSNLHKHWIEQENLMQSIKIMGGTIWRK